MGDMECEGEDTIVYQRQTVVVLFPLVNVA